MKFQVELTISSQGYITVDAPDKDAACKRVRTKMTPEINLGDIPEDFDVSLFDVSPNVRIYGAVEDDGQ